jgi:hypothetical protein
MLRKLTLLLPVAVLLGAAPAFAQAPSHHVMQPQRHVRVSPYVGGFPDYALAASAYALAPATALATGSCPEIEGYPDCP